MMTASMFGRIVNDRRVAKSSRRVQEKAFLERRRMPSFTRLPICTRGFVPIMVCTQANVSAAVTQSRVAVFDSPEMSLRVPSVPIVLDGTGLCRDRQSPWCTAAFRCFSSHPMKSLR